MADRSMCGRVYERGGFVEQHQLFFRHTTDYSKELLLTYPFWYLLSICLKEKKGCPGENSTADTTTLSITCERLVPVSN